MRIQVVIAFLLGVNAALLGTLVFSGPSSVMPVHAQSVQGGGAFIAATDNYYENGGRNLLWLVDTAQRRLCLYEAKETGFALKFARNFTYDFMYDQYPGRADAQVPSVEEVFRETKKKRDEERKAPSGSEKGK